MTTPDHLLEIQQENINWKEKDKGYWRENLPRKTYSVTREKGTERPFTGEYTRFFEEGEYCCFNCGQVLFGSEAKFEGGCGWPSFSKTVNESVLEEKKDHSMMMERTEVLCTRCGAHLGHVFDDGPEPTGLRYCINSLSLFHQAKGNEESKERS